MIPPLQKGELYKIASNVYSMLKRNELRLILNEERRVLVNPKFNCTGKERQAITAKVLGMEKMLKRMREIFNCIEDWDFEKNVLIT